MNTPPTAPLAFSELELQWMLHQIPNAEFVGPMGRAVMDKLKAGQAHLEQRKLAPKAGRLIKGDVLLRLPNRREVIFDRSDVCNGRKGYWFTCADFVNKTSPRGLCLMSADDVSKHCIWPENDRAEAGTTAA